MTKKRFLRKTKNSPYKNLPLDVAIGVCGLLLLGFIYSFSRNATHTGVPVNVKFPKSNEPKILAKDVFQNNPVQNIKIEVLNGCGIKGIAAKTSEFLRTNHRIDVIRSDNADRYDYPKTMIIGRNENLDKIILVCKSFGVSIEDKTIIKHEPNESLGVDVTVIIGKDVSSFTEIYKFISNKI